MIRAGGDPCWSLLDFYKQGTVLVAVIIVYFCLLPNVRQKEREHIWEGGMAQSILQKWEGEIK